MWPEGGHLGPVEGAQQGLHRSSKHGGPAPEPGEACTPGRTDDLERRISPPHRPRRFRKEVKHLSHKQGKAPQETFYPDRRRAPSCIPPLEILTLETGVPAPHPIGLVSLWGEEIRTQTGTWGRPSEGEGKSADRTPRRAVPGEAHPLDTSGSVLRPPRNHDSSNTPSGKHPR